MQEQLTRDEQGQTTSTDLNTEESVGAEGVTSYITPCNLQPKDEVSLST